MIKNSKHIKKIFKLRNMCIIYYEIPYKISESLSPRYFIIKKSTMRYPLLRQCINFSHKDELTGEDMIEMNKIYKECLQNKRVQKFLEEDN